MLPIVVSLATLAILVFGVTKPIFPTYQIQSFTVVDVSLNYPSWLDLSKYLQRPCHSEPIPWRCYFLWDWKKLFTFIGNLNDEVLQNNTFSCANDEQRIVRKEYCAIGDPAEEERNQLQRELVADNKSPQKKTTIYNISSFIEKFLNFEVSAHVHAGISIDNRDNLFGAHVHGATLNIYHEDWSGRLMNIGTLRDRFGDCCLPYNNEMMVQNDVAQDAISWDATTEFSHKPGTNSTKASEYYLVHQHFKESNISSSIGKPLQQSNDSLSGKTTYQYQQPTLKVLPRTIAHTGKDAFSLYLRDLSPVIILSLFRDLVTNKGNIQIPSTGVVHLKMTSSLVPFTVGVICENEVHVSLKSILNSFYNTWIGGYFYNSPWISIDKAHCVMERLATGWWDASKMGDDLKYLATARYADTGDVLR